MKIKLPHVSWLTLGLAIAIIVWDVGLLVFGVPWSEREEYLRSLAGKEVTLLGIVAEDPDTSAEQTTYRLTELRLGCNEGVTKAWSSDDGRETRLLASGQSSRECVVNGTVYVSGVVNGAIKRGDTVVISGKMRSGFGIFAGSFYRPKVLSLTHPDPPDLFLTLRDDFAEEIRRFLPSKEAALGLGYLLGVRSSLPEGLDEALKATGLTHIIVASGANLSILIQFSRRCFGKISRRAGMVVSLLLVVIYMGMVGLSPSMVRAGIVSILSLVAWYVGRRFTPGRLLLIVAAITLVYNPMYLVDLGWLLSFGSFAGVMIVGPWLTKFFYGTHQPGVIGATLIESVSASLICTPIILFFFGTMSIISLLANLLVLPTISLAMGLCFIVGVTGIAGASWLAGGVGQVATWVLGYHLGVIDFLGSRKEFIITIPTGQWQVFLVYVPFILIMIKEYIKIRRNNATNQNSTLDGINKAEDVIT